MNGKGDFGRPGRGARTGEGRGVGQGGEPRGGGRGWCRGGRGGGRLSAGLDEGVLSPDGEASLRTILENLNRRLRALETERRGSAAETPTDV